MLFSFFDKTTYLKYKEHLYVKFNNYLLSVKNLQEYIYSKDIKQVKNSKKKKKNLVLISNKMS